MEDQLSVFDETNVEFSSFTRTTLENGIYIIEEVKQKKIKLDYPEGQAKLLRIGGNRSFEFEFNGEIYKSFEDGVAQSEKTFIGTKNIQLDRNVDWVFGRIYRKLNKGSFWVVVPDKISPEGLEDIPSDLMLVKGKKIRTDKEKEFLVHSIFYSDFRSENNIIILSNVIGYEK